MWILPYVFDWLYFTQCLTSFCTVCDSISSNIEASNNCKSVLEAAKHAYANKRKESITSQKLESWDFWRIANSVLNKGKSAKPPLFNNRRCCLLHLIKQNCLLKTFLKTLILMTQVSLFLLFLLELI